MTVLLGLLASGGARHAAASAVLVLRGLWLSQRRSWSGVKPAALSLHPSPGRGVGGHHSISFNRQLPNPLTTLASGAPEPGTAPEYACCVLLLTGPQWCVDGALSALRLNRPGERGRGRGAKACPPLRGPCAGRVQVHSNTSLPAHPPFRCPALPSSVKSQLCMVCGLCLTIRDPTRWAQDFGPASRTLGASVSSSLRANNLRNRLTEC